MRIDEAIAELNERLQDAPWFTMVGRGKSDGHDCIALYVRSMTSEARAYERGWRGHRVVLHKMAPPRLVRERAFA